MFGKISSIFIFVRDIEQSSDWYRRLFGMQPAEEYPDFVLFRVGHYNVCLHPADAKSPVGSGNQVAYWRVPDFEEALQHALALGAELYRGPLHISDSHTICQLRDPFGNIFGLEYFEEPVE